MTAADKDSGRTEDGARHERVAEPRRLRVFVGTLPIEDGQLRPPAVGEVTRLTLTFTEADAADADGPEADGDEAGVAVSTVVARAEPLRDGTPVGPGRQWDGTEREGPVTWPTVLHGDGWSATWSAPPSGPGSGAPARAAGRRPGDRRADRGARPGHPRPGDHRDERR